MAGITDGKGKILKNAKPLFAELAKKYPCDNYTSFCDELGVGFEEANQILKSQNLGNQEKALKQVLNKWLNSGKEVNRAKLESALENADTGGLKSIVKRHFTKDAVDDEEESSKDAVDDEEESSEGDGPGTKRKKEDSSPGPSTRNKKKKIDDTKVTDDVIDELAEDIGINTKLGKLGLKLGFGFPAMKRYKAKNRGDGDVTFEGTKDMLIHWREGKGQGMSSVLKKALIDAGLHYFAEKYFKDA